MYNKLNMSIWDFVSANTFDSPVNQITLLVKETKKRIKKQNPKILDAGGGLEDRGSLISNLGSTTVLDLVPGPGVDVVGDIHKLPFPDNSFDVITLFMVMEHLYDPLRAIKEFRRVLKKDGILIGTTVQYWHTHGHPNDYYRYTESGLNYIFEDAKLPIQKIWSSGGPFLVLFHVMELNLPSPFRQIILYLCPIFNYLDKLVFNHQDKRKYSDSVGWSFLAKK